jgi:predicted nucleic acid-binding protein
VKLVIEEPESSRLRHHLQGASVLASSHLASVEVMRAVRLAHPATEGQEKAKDLLESCLLVEVSEPVLQEAADLASATLRTLDAIHLASALRIQPDQLLTYDRRLSAAGIAHGLSVSSPGAG